MDFLVDREVQIWTSYKKYMVCKVHMDFQPEIYGPYPPYMIFLLKNVVGKVLK